MRTLLTLICAFALACSASAAKDQNKSKKQAQNKKQVQSAHHGRAASAPKKMAPRHNQAASHTTSHQKAQGGRKGVNNQVHQSRSNVKPANKASRPVATQNRQAGRQATSVATSKKAKQGQRRVNPQAHQARSNAKTKKSSQQIAAHGSQHGRNTSANSRNAKQRNANRASAATFQSNSKNYKARRFNLASNRRPTQYSSVKFHQNRRIQGSQHWNGSNYWAFRNYRPTWHNNGWWRSHYNRVVFVYGGWYYWNAGWWYPAWGYAPNSYYAWDGPIYAYNNLPPDQVIANVQAALQAQGYYRGQVDGLLGPLTRGAIAEYQRDHGLYMTSAIDRPTLDSLGMA